jgi:N-acetylglucosaminyldiphosphoundecaprenol N-acetyl-beta-D-mannosaminyltransferase
MRKINFMGCSMHAVTVTETVSEIISRIEREEFTQHVVVNVAKIVNMRKDPTLDESVRGCDIINIDGMGVVFGARMLGHYVPERVAGVDLFFNLLQMSAKRGLPVFLLGAKDEVITEARNRIERLYPDLDVVGHHHGYFWNNEVKVVKKIKESGARLLFVAITSPKKENFINKWKDQLGVDFVMGVGGTFDVVAGKVKRAPVWMQSYGLEWLYRVAQEPGRMWKRYLFTNAEFLWLLIKEKLNS